jgi:hypothetical protein
MMTDREQAYRERSREVHERTDPAGRPFKGLTRFDPMNLTYAELNSLIKHYGSQDPTTPESCIIYDALRSVRNFRLEFDEDTTYTLDRALRLAELWRAGKMIGGSQHGVIMALLAEIERLLKG